MIEHSTPRVVSPIMTTYRFNRKWIKQFASDNEAVDYSLGYDDHIQAVIEKLINGEWVEMTDGNDAAWD